MTYKIILTDQARSDLSEIFAWIARENSERGENFVGEFLDKIRSLKAMPERCPLALEAAYHPHELRHLVYRSYRIVFALSKKRVVILRIVHGSRIHQ
ncbi:MAG: type II toxin-antitoxin system RelE/ParE family toxin [Pseudomonadota bacterium]|nr:type II toxin-antitoxin system RelE/ParE family toxin [Pseudomonadota bacterium]